MSGGVYGLRVTGSATTAFVLDVPVAAFVVGMVLLLGIVLGVLLARRERHWRRPPPTVIAAEPEDRPLPAVVAHPLRTAVFACPVPGSSAVVSSHSGSRQPSSTH